MSLKSWIKKKIKEHDEITERYWAVKAPGLVIIGETPIGPVSEQ